MNKLPDISFVRECLTYNRRTGTFRWRKRPPHHFPSLRIRNTWNKRFAGKTAGFLCQGGPRRVYWTIEFAGEGRHKAHRLVWLLERGEPVPPLIDHKDSDSLNNRISNLRAATKSQNGANQRRQDRKTTSGVKGVFRHSRRYPRTPFVAHIAIDKIRYHLGYFSSLEEAVAARQKAATKLHGRFSRHE
jgi:hypothetical protein